MLRIVPLTLKTANEFVREKHRHHKPVVGQKFSIGLKEGDQLVGVCITGRPVARACNQETVLEVTRLCTDGSKNACSMLYSAAARIAKEMGYEKIQTYILETEPGTSLKACGWVAEAVTKGGQWKRSEGTPRRTDQPDCPKVRWAKKLQFTEQAVCVV